MQPFRQAHQPPQLFLCSSGEHKTCDKIKISPLTSMTVHCSTTMASYVGVATFGSPSLPSWKMKTLSTDLGSISAERKGKKNLSVKRVFTGWSVCLSCLCCSFTPSRPEEMEWYHSATFTQNPLLHSQWCGPFVWAMCTYTLCRETV